ncbi:MAG TPA: TIM44-like domain-containing protein [Candidatus Dormibacteraeota bacterium]|nr:TIM44-like domain-containing protein [Candidatus Dormibacteraeota bacterium]
MSSAPPADPAIGLGQIQAADPAFDLELFKRQAVQTFLAVKEAIQTRDLTGVVDQLSDGVFDDLQLDVQSLEARDAIQHFDGLAPTQVLVAAAERSPAGEVITLRIQAVAMEYLGLADAPSSAPGAPSPFTEFWTFTRPFDAMSPSVHRNECPTCGAPIDVDTGRICHYCKTLLPPPHAQTGWVVAAIQAAQENRG